MNHKYIEEIMDIEESPYGWSKAMSKISYY